MRRQEQGSALMLVPAGVLIVLLLGALCVDSAAAYLAQRRLADAVEQAANDAAGAAFDVDALRSGRIDPDAPLDPVAAERIVRDALAAADTGGVAMDPASLVIRVDGRRVTVSVAGDADRVFGSAVPGVSHTYHVRATATAELRGG